MENINDSFLLLKSQDTLRSKIKTVEMESITEVKMKPKEGTAKKTQKKVSIEKTNEKGSSWAWTIF